MFIYCDNSFCFLDRSQETRPIPCWPIYSNRWLSGILLSGEKPQHTIGRPDCNLLSGDREKCTIGKTLACEAARDTTLSGTLVHIGGLNTTILSGCVSREMQSGYRGGLSRNCRRVAFAHRGKACTYPYREPSTIRIIRRSRLSGS